MDLEYFLQDVPMQVQSAESTASVNGEGSVIARRGRGPGYKYSVLRQFPTRPEFQEWWAAEKKNWTLQDKKNNANEKAETWFCKYAGQYSGRKAYRCKARIRVLFPFTDDSVTVMCCQNAHNHEPCDATSEGLQLQSTTDGLQTCDQINNVAESQMPDHNADVSTACRSDILDDCADSIALRKRQVLQLRQEFRQRRMDIQTAIRETQQKIRLLVNERSELVARCAEVQQQEDELADEWDQIVDAQMERLHSHLSLLTRTASSDSHKLPALNEIHGSQSPQTVFDDSTVHSSAASQNLEPSPVKAEPVQEEESAITHDEEIAENCDNPHLARVLEHILSGETPQEANTTSGPSTSAECSRVSKRQSSSRPKAVKRIRLQKITLEELRNYASNIGSYWSKTTRGFECPQCGHTPSRSGTHAVFTHLLDHLGEEAYFPYRCPMDGCDFARVRQNDVPAHCRNVHKLLWTEELKEASVHNENKALIHSIFEEAKRVWDSDAEINPKPAPSTPPDSLS